MPGTYFLPRLLLAFVVPLTLASIGPITSHPELGTDMAASKRNDNQIYRANDIQTQVALNEVQKPREVVKLEAYKRGQKVHFKRRDE